MVCAPLFLPFVSCCCNFYCFCLLLAAACIHHQILPIPAGCCYLSPNCPVMSYPSKSLSIQVQLHSFSSSKPCMSTISLSVSQYLLFILWLAESRRFANRCRHCWCGNALLVPFGAVLLHIMTNGHLFVVIIMSSRCLPSCSSELSPLRLAGLTHLKILSSSRLQSKARV